MKVTKDRVKNFLRGKNAPSPGAMRLCAVLYLLLLSTRLISRDFLATDGTYLSTALLELMIFPIPAYLFAHFRMEKPVKAIRLTPPRPSHLFLILSATGVLIAGCTLLAMLCGSITRDTSFTLYDTFSSGSASGSGELIGMIVAYALLPAFCEELVFRGIVCSLLEKYGIIYASLVSSLLFAMLHFNLPALPVYVLSGTVLALVTYISRSLVASMLVHLLYNLFGLFVQAGLSGYCRNMDSLGLLIVVLIMLLLLSAAVFCGETSRILKRRSVAGGFGNVDEISTPGLSVLTAKQFFPAVGRAFACPEGVISVILWLVFAVMALFS